MAKYHVNGEGKIGLCKATVRPCPLGGQEVHFNSMEEAEVYSQGLLEEAHRGDLFGGGGVGGNGPGTLPPGGIRTAEGTTLTEYDKHILSEINLDGVTVAYLARHDGHLPEYVLTDGVTEPFAFSFVDIRNDGATFTSRRGQLFTPEGLQEAIDRVRGNGPLLERTHELINYLPDDLSTDDSIELLSRIRKNEEVLGESVNDRVSDFAFSSNEGERVIAAKAGYHPEVLKKDKSPEVRRGVALSGNCLEELYTDEDVNVRVAVALSGQMKEELIKDPAPEVRATVIEEVGYGVSSGLSDESELVRIAAARVGDYQVLQELEGDRSPEVRIEVAKRYRVKDQLTLLENDSDPRVQEYVRELKEKNREKEEK